MYPLSKQFDKTYKDLYNTAISVFRQPIKSFFSWVIQLTNIQNELFFRSEGGLNVHILGRLACTLILLANI
jgi:hypothetical protein